ncbi:DUF4118 domain-containing protein [Arthrobacter crystallopoietes]|uniref:histidine kinase n=1 Tax=Crystallibacter crystallopoietes TaxID=37928 RepID=A0A1H0ZUE0_9MICC|nr:DUF4118 domain-containing protein [Arthrobacter crystallopoietes]AUI51808.1 histidine kinase [Arthrobacter crystallopoietes]SDQ31095.1 two-component system, OmpR family, sensor histidine kinase KdpD [Arthrobacter crystallopoietes]
MTDIVPERECVLVGLSGGPEGQALLRRAARLVAGRADGELHAVHVRATGRAGTESPKELDLQRKLVTELGGTYHTVGGGDPAQTLLDFARSINATQIVVGVPRGMFSRGTGARLVRAAGDIDVHLVAQEHGGSYRPARRPNDLGRLRLVAGFVLAVFLPPALQYLLGHWPHDHFATDLLIQLTGTIAVALLGGLWPAVTTAVLSSLIVNYFAVQPVGSMDIRDPENILTLLVFLAVAVSVSLVVGLSARRSREASAAGAEAAALGELSRNAVATQESVPEFLERVREHFQSDGAGLYVRKDNDGEPDAWHPVHSAGIVPSKLQDADNLERMDATRTLALTGRILNQRERRLLTAFGAHLLAMLQRDQLMASRRDVQRLAEGNQMRTSILRAVSHDLRTPLAGIKLAVSSLRQDAVQFPPEEEAELLATIEDYTDRLDSLVGNLLDMSRITGDSMAPLIRPVHWQDAVADALRGLPAEHVLVDLPDNMPPVDADQGMLERVIANIVENALKYARGSDVRITGLIGGMGSATVDGRPASELRIIDAGQGVPAEQVISMFRPFQRLDDAPAGTGIGLGLAVAKGFTEAMGGRLLAEHTPGGGLTMVIQLPLSTGV